jgi:hypothetical protein
MARATNPIQIVAGFKVRSPAGMDQFITRVAQAIRLESRIGANARFPSLANLQKQARRVPKADTARLAGFFAKIRDYANKNRAPQTAAAVVQAASWFYYNVEGGRPAPAAPAVVNKGPRATFPDRSHPGALVRPRMRPSQSPAAPPAAPAASQGKPPLTQRMWFWPTVVGGVGLLLAGGILLMGRR